MKAYLTDQSASLSSLSCLPGLPIVRKKEKERKKKGEGEKKDKKKDS